MAVPIAAIIGAGVSAAGSIFGGISSRRQMKKARRALEQMQRDNDAWYNRRMNEDATQRADAQRLLTMTEEAIKDRNRAAAGRAAVMGATDEAAAAEREQNNKIMSDTMSNVAAQAASRKDAIEDRYLTNKGVYNQQRIQNYNTQAQQTAEAVKGLASAAGSVVSAFDNSATALPKNQTT